MLELWDKMQIKHENQNSKKKTKKGPTIDLTALIGSQKLGQWLQ